MNIATTTITSLEVAEITGKRHSDLMRSIRNMEESWAKVNGRRFALVEYLDPKGEKRPMFALSKTECLFIATKFNDEARAKLVIRWQKLEESNMSVAPPSRKQLAQWVVELEEKNEAQQKQIDKLRPKAEFMDRVIDTDTKVDIGQAAKLLNLGYGRNTLFRKLKEKGIFFQGRNEPKQEYIKRGYFVLKEKYIERDNHEGFVVIKVLITQKGLEYLSKVFEVQRPSTQLALLQ